jgi:hypothetical protein
MNYTYKSRATKKSYALEQIIDLPATEREVLRNDLEDAIDGMRREMYEERHNVDSNDKWFRAVNYKLGICTSFLDEIESVESLDMSEVDKVMLVFLRKKLKPVLGSLETDRIFAESRALAAAHIKSIAE